MVLPKELNLEAVKNRLLDIKKEKSEAYAEYWIDKTSLEYKIQMLSPLEEFSEQEEKNFNYLKQMVETKTKNDLDKLLRKTEPQIIRDYNKVKDQKNIEDSLENSKKGMNDLKEFLEIVNQLIEEVDAELQN